MMRRIAATAAGRGCDTIHIKWRPSERNDAACHFFTGIPGAEFVEVPSGGGVETLAQQDQPPGSGSMAVAAGAGAGADVDDDAAAEYKYNPDDYKWQNFMTPELELLGKKARKAELRRRVKEAQARCCASSARWQTFF